MRKKFLLWLLIAVPCFGFGPRSFAPQLFAQTADRIERLLSQEQVSYRDSALLVLEASGQIDLLGHLDQLGQASADEAFSFAVERGWLPKGAEANGITKLNGLSLLIMRAFEIDGGFFYALFKNPHYAYRAMVYRDIIQGRSDPQMLVSGSLLLYTVNKAINREQ
jgi:hypothetical protein